MAITLEQTSETTLTGTGTSHTITLPSTGIDADDLIWIVCSTQESAAAGAPTTPSGYTQRWSLGHASSFRPEITCVYKIADGTEESDVVTFDWGATSVETHIVCCVFRGVDTTTPFDVTQTGPTSGGSNPDPASITTSTDDAWVIALAAANRAPTPAVTISTGYTSAFSQVPDDRAFVITRKEVATAGADNPSAWTWTVLDNHTTVTDALRPATGIASELATSTGTAHDATVGITAGGVQTAESLGTASNPEINIGANVELATSIGSAYNPTIFTGKLASPEKAGSTGQAYNAKIVRGTTSIFNSLATEEIGSSDGGDVLDGKVMWAQVKDGIDGTPVLFFDARTVPIGSASFTDSLGATWTLRGTAEIIAHTSVTVQQTKATGVPSNIVDYDNDGSDEPITGLAVIGEGEGDDQKLLYLQQTVGDLPLWEDKKSWKYDSEDDHLIERGQQVLAEEADVHPIYTVVLDNNLAPFHEALQPGIYVRLIINDRYTLVNSLFWIGKMTVVLGKEQDEKISLELTQ